MRSVLLLLALLPLGACMQADPPGRDLHARQEAACTAAIAAHVGRPPAEIAARRLSETNGIATIQTRDGGRLHLCSVDASGRVLGYSHPGAWPD